MLLRILIDANSNIYTGLLSAAPVSSSSQQLQLAAQSWKQTPVSGLFLILKKNTMILNSFSLDFQILDYFKPVWMFSKHWMIRFITPKCSFSASVIVFIEKRQVVSSILIKLSFNDTSCSVQKRTTKITSYQHRKTLSKIEYLCF